MKRSRIIYASGIAGVVLLTIVGCGTNGTVAPRNSSKTTTNNTAVTSGTQQQYKLLFPIHYTSRQIDQIKQIAKAQGIKVPFILTKGGGNGGVYKLMHSSGRNHVLTLNYEEVTISQASYFDDLSNSFQAFAKGNKMTEEKSVKLSKGIQAQWWKLSYSSGSIVEFLTLHMNNTWIALMPPPSQAANKPLVQAMAEALQPASSIS